MTSLNTILGIEVRRFGAHRGLVLGDEEPGPDEKGVPRSYSEDDKRHLLASLKAQSAFSANLVIAIAALHVGLFVAAMFLVYHYRDSPSAITLVFGGSLLSLLGIATSLRAVWRDKVASDLLAAILPSLRPEDALTAITDAYLAHKRSSKTRAPRSRRPKTGA